MDHRGGETDSPEAVGEKLEGKKSAFVVDKIGGASASSRRLQLERLLSDPQFFRTLVDTMPDVGFIVDLEGNFVYTTAAAKSLTGYSSEELREMNMADLVTPEVLAKLDERLRRRLRGETLTEMELEIVARDGSRRVVEMRTSPIVDKRGRLLGVHGIVRDQTLRRKAERESERRAEYLRALAELSALLLESQGAAPVEAALGILGKAARVQRVRLFDHVRDEKGHTIAVATAIWTSREEQNPQEGRWFCVYRNGELDALERVVGESGIFSGALASVLGSERISDRCPDVGSVALIALAQPIGQHGFAVFEDANPGRPWSEWELDFLRTGVHLIAQAQVRSRMTRNEQLLASFGEAVAGVDSREKLAEVLSEFTRRHFGWDAFVLALRATAPDQSDFLFLVDTDENGEQIQEQRDSWSAQSLGPRAVRILRGQSLLINRQPAAEGEPLETFGFRQRKSASLMFVPVAGEKHVEGMISVQSYTPFKYRHEDLQCLERLAGLAALVLGRLRTQAALSGAERRFQTIADMAGAYIWSADVEGDYPNWKLKYRLYTSGMERVAGVPASEFMREGSTVWLEMIHPDDRTVMDEALARLAKGEKVVGTYRIRRPDGTVRWVRDSVIPTQGTDGRVVRLDGLCLDVTEEQEIAEERDRLFRAIDRAGEAIVLLSSKGLVEYANRAFSEMSGLPVDEVKGKLWYELGLFEEELARRQDEILHNLRTRGHWAGQTTLRARAKPLPIEMAVSAVKGAQGSVQHWVVTLRDVSERVLLEEQLRQSQKLEAIGTLAAGIAHDFNNLLTGILGNIELAALEAPPDLQGYFDDARKIAHRAADLVRQLLAFARKAPGSKQPLALGSLLKETTKIVAETTDRRIRVEARVPDDLWVVEGDAVQLQQLIMNLCVNARDALSDCLAGAECAASRKGELPTMRVIAENVDGREAPLPFPGAAPGLYVRITVSDNGPGMSEEVRSRIFEPFFTTKEAGKGTGLGLATVYGIVTQHHGYIRVDSGPAQGAKFEVYLPALADATSAAEMEGEDSLKAIYSSPGAETILLVDDEDSVRSYLAELLKRAGYEVVEAKDGREAVKRFRRLRKKVSLLVMDLVMPVMDGQEALAAIRELRPDIKVVMLSGAWQAEAMRRLQRYGVSLFFEKPPRVREFLRGIRKVLDEDNEARTNIPS